MKKILVLFLAAMTMIACATKKAEPQPTAAQQLLERLDSIRQNSREHGGRKSLNWLHDPR